MTAPNPSVIGNFPDKFEEFRPHQWQAAMDVLASFNSGARIVFLEAGTGSGKTLVAEIVRQCIASQQKSLYTCTTHTLQRQFVDDFPVSVELKGKRNYTPMDVLPDMGVTCDDCNYQQGQCTWCSEPSFCPYRRQKEQAVASKLAVINMPYLLAETKGAGRMSGRSLGIIDEGATIESQLMNSVEVVLTPGLLERLKVSLPPVAGDADRWWPWMAGPLLEGLSLHANHLQRQLHSVRPGSNEFLRISRGLRSATRKIESVEAVVHGDPSDWVYEGPSEAGKNRRTARDYERISIKPIVVADIAEEVLWQHADKWLVMDAAFVSVDQTAYDLGLVKSDYAKVQVDYAFPKARRPIRFWGSMTYSRKTERDGSAQADRAPKIQQISDWWPEGRILIHSVSHQRTREIVEALDTDRTVAFFTDAAGRKDAMDLYLSTPGAILVGAGLERGVDLPYDKCRVVVIAKVPWPNRGDKQINARMTTPGGQQWYTMQTVRSLVQMTGRGMRHEDDWCVTYILDGAFQQIRGSTHRGMIPDNWARAIRFGEPKEREPVEVYIDE